MSKKKKGAGGGGGWVGFVCGAQRERERESSDTISMNRNHKVQTERTSALKQTNLEHCFSSPSKVISKRHRLAAFGGEKQLVSRTGLHLLPLRVTTHKQLIVIQAPTLRPGARDFAVSRNSKCLHFVRETMNELRRKRNRQGA